MSALIFLVFLAASTVARAQLPLEPASQHGLVLKVFFSHRSITTVVPTLAFTDIISLGGQQNCRPSSSASDLSFHSCFPIDDLHDLADNDTLFTLEFHGFIDLNWTTGAVDLLLHCGSDGAGVIEDIIVNGQPYNRSNVCSLGSPIVIFSINHATDTVCSTTIDNSTCTGNDTCTAANSTDIVNDTCTANSTDNGIAVVNRTLEIYARISIQSPYGSRFWIGYKNETVENTFDVLDYHLFYHRTNGTVLTHNDTSIESKGKAVRRFWSNNSCPDRPNIFDLPPDSVPEINRFACWFGGISCRFAEDGNISITTLYVTCAENAKSNFTSDGSLELFNDLKVLRLSNYEDVDIAIISSISTLDVLYLERVSFSGETTSMLENLTFVYISSNNNIGHINLSYISYAVEVEVYFSNRAFPCLNLPTRIDYLTFLPNSKLTRLCDLRNHAIQRLSFGDTDLRQLTEIELPESLESLNLSQSMFLQGDKDTDISYLSSLRELDVSYNDLRLWRRIYERVPSNITQLEMYYCELRNLDILSNLNNLKYLYADNVHSLDWLKVEDYNTTFPSTLELISCRSCDLFGPINQAFFSAFPSSARVDLESNFYFSADLDFRNDLVFHQISDFTNIVAIYPDFVLNPGQFFSLRNNRLQGYFPPRFNNGDGVLSRVDINYNVLWNRDGLSLSPFPYKYFDRDQRSKSKFLRIYPAVFNPFESTRYEIQYYVDYCGYTYSYYYAPRLSYRLPGSNTWRYIRLYPSNWENGGLFSYNITLENHVSLTELKRRALNKYENPNSSPFLIFQIRDCYYYSFVGPVLEVETECSPGKGGIGEGIQFTCYDCDEGFASEGGTAPCVPCPRGQYQKLEGQSSCNACPVGYTTSQIGSNSILECICEDGSYGNIYKGCQPCPANSECSDGSEYPIVQPGFFIDPVNVGVLECIPKESCSNTTGLITTCAEGYTGYLCGQCIPFMYYRLNSECYECGSQAMKFVMFSFLGIFMLVFIVKISTPGGKIGTTFRLIVVWIQIIALFPSFSDDWSESLKTILGVVSFTNFNIDVASPGCAIQLSFWDEWILKLLTPVFAASFLLLLYLLQVYILKKYNKSLFSITLKEIRGCSIEKNEGPPKDEFAASRFVYSFISIVTALYTMILSTSIEPFNCTPQKSGVFTMTFSPSLQCYDDVWWAYFPWMVVVVCVYIIIVPGLVFFILYVNRYDVETLKFRRYFGSLTKPYSSKFFYWEFVTILKKILIILAADFFSRQYSSDQSKVFMILSILFVFHVLEQLVRPYRTSHYNHMMLIWSVVTIAILLSTFVFGSDEVSIQEKRAFSASVATLLISACVASLLKVLANWKPTARYFSWAEFGNSGDKHERRTSKENDHVIIL